MTRPSLPHGPREVVIELPLGPLTMWVPAGTDALLDELADAPPDPDDKMPYWADLWPSAIALAELIEEGGIPVAGRTVTELGAGLGLVSLAAARSGAEVRATDWDEDALSYIRANAETNRLAVTAEHLDWRTPDPRFRAPTVLAADVLYEARNVASLARAIAELVEPGGEAWLADPGRAPLVDFVRTMDGYALAHTERAMKDGHHRIQLVRIRARPRAGHDT